MTTNRKDDHVNEASKQYHNEPTDFENIRFVHHSIPRYNQAEIELSTTILNHQLDTPFYINAMTGGSEWTKQVNKQLAMVAKETGLMMATGSLSAALKDPSVADTFKIAREVNPDGFLLANLGANHGLENARKAVAMIDANAYQIHLNTPQEIVMPEGDRDFRTFFDHIDEIVNGLDVPVIVKEVGFGMSAETLQTLKDIGVKTIDVSGYGGTNFSTIENARREKQEMAYLSDWGQSTAISLLEAQPFIDTIDIVASGGIKTPLQMVKAFALGAKAIGMSGEFLHQVLYHGVDSTVETVHEWKNQLQLLCLLLNAKTIDTLKTTDLILSPELMHWAKLREIPVNQFAKRSQN